MTPLEVTASVGLVGAGLAFTAALLSLRQKAHADQRAAWWTRAQWAIDSSLSADPGTQQIGIAAMVVLAADRQATPADLQVLDAALVRALDTR